MPFLKFYHMTVCLLSVSVSLLYLSTLPSILLDYKFPKDNDLLISVVSLSLPSPFFQVSDLYFWILTGHCHMLFNRHIKFSVAQTKFILFHPKPAVLVPPVFPALFTRINIQLKPRNLCYP